MIYCWFNWVHLMQNMLVTHWFAVPSNESILWIGTLNHLFSIPWCGLELPNKDLGSQGKTAVFHH